MASWISRSSIVAYWLHHLVCDWVSKNVLSLDHLLAVREQVNRRLSGASQELAQRRAVLTKRMSKVNRSIEHLLDGLEASGFNREIGDRLAERKAERARLVAELSEVNQLEKTETVEISNEALAYLAAHLGEELTSGNPKDVRGVLRKVVRRVELHEEKIAIHYVSPLLPQVGGNNVAFGQHLDRCVGGSTVTRSAPSTEFTTWNTLTWRGRATGLSRGQWNFQLLHPPEERFLRCLEVFIASRPN
jgi:hypothetical protein